MQLTLKLLAGAAAAGLSFGAAAQPASQAQGASQQQPAGDTAAQSASQAQGASQQQPAGDAAAQQTSQDSTAASADLKPVTAATVKAGDKVNDTKGDPVGKIESVSGKTAVISSGSARAQIPLSSLGRNEKGLVIAMTKSQFDAAAKAKTRKQ